MYIHTHTYIHTYLLQCYTEEITHPAQLQYFSHWDSPNIQRGQPDSFLTLHSEGTSPGALWWELKLVLAAELPTSATLLIVNSDLEKAQNFD